MDIKAEFRAFLNEERFEYDIELITNLRKKFWEPYGKKTGIKYKVQNLKDGIRIETSEKFYDDLYDYLENNNIRVSLSSYDKNSSSFTIKTYLKGN